MSTTITPLPWLATGLLRNNVPNPSAEAATLSLEVEAAASVARTATVGVAWPPAGAYSYEVTATSTARATVRLLYTARPAAQAGETWWARVKVRSSAAAARSLRIGLNFYDAAAGAATQGTILQRTVVAVTVDPLTPTDLIVTATAPAGTASVGFTLDRDNVAGAATGDLFRADQLMLTARAGTDAPDYFDGDTAPLGRDRLYAWDGTPHQSASRLTYYDPAYAIVPDLVLGYQASRELTTIVHRLLSGDVRFGYRTPAPRAGSMRMFFASRSAAFDAMARLDDPHAWALADAEHPHTNMVFAVAGGQVTIELDPESMAAWVLTVPYQEGPE
jgi:hypothetical protein